VEAAVWLGACPSRLEAFPENRSCFGRSLVVADRLKMAFQIHDFPLFPRPDILLSDALKIAGGLPVHQQYPRRDPLGQGQLKAFRPLFRRYFDGS
jgi:hypothetical protein